MFPNISKRYSRSRWQIADRRWKSGLKKMKKVSRRIWSHHGVWTLIYGSAAALSFFIQFFRFCRNLDLIKLAEWYQLQHARRQVNQAVWFHSMLILLCLFPQMNQIFVNFLLALIALSPPLMEIPYFLFNYFSSLCHWKAINISFAPLFVFGWFIFRWWRSETEEEENVFVIRSEFRFVGR